MQKLIVITFIFLSIVSISACLLLHPVCSKMDKSIHIPVNAELLKKHVTYLSTIKPSRSNQNQSGLDTAACYIVKYFSKYCNAVIYQNYSVKKFQFKNIIASFDTANKERIIIGAHYDACDDLPAADDNASGVAGLLEIAHLLDSLKPKLKYRIDLVAYSTEEPPYYATEKMGSYIHANSLYSSKANVKLMISLEMIGYFDDKQNSQEYPLHFLKMFYPNTGNFIVVLGKFGQGSAVKKVKRHMIHAANLNVRSMNAPESLGGVDMSDNRSYWKFGYNAVMISNTAFYRNKNYHTQFDTAEKLDYPKMAEVVKGVFNTILNYN